MTKINRATKAPLVKTMARATPPRMKPAAQTIRGYLVRLKRPYYFMAHSNTLSAYDIKSHYS